MGRFNFFLPSSPSVKQTLAIMAVATLINVAFEDRSLVLNVK